MEPGQQHCAGGIVFDDRRRLLVIERGHEPSAGLWSIPGGRCLPGEDSASACVREVAEETGLSVRVVRWAGQVELDAPVGTYLVDDYVCELTGGTLSAGDDATKAGGSAGLNCWPCRLHRASTKHWQAGANFLSSGSCAP